MVFGVRRLSPSACPGADIRLQPGKLWVSAAKGATGTCRRAALCSMWKPRVVVRFWTEQPASKVNSTPIAGINPPERSGRR